MSVILNFKVNAGVIRCTSNSTIPANTVKHVRAKFIFEEDWSSYSVKIATFTNEKTGFVRRAILDKENLCVIPWEPLMSGGTLSIDIEGRVSLEDGTSAIARASMEYEIRLIENNVHTDGSEDTIIGTPDILTKTLENIELIEQYAAASQSAQENAQNAAQSASVALEAERKAGEAAQEVQENVKYIESIEKLIEAPVKLTWDREAYPDLLSFLRSISDIGRYTFSDDEYNYSYILEKADIADTGTEFYGTLKCISAVEEFTETVIYSGSNIAQLTEAAPLNPVTHGYLDFRIPNPIAADKGKVLKAAAAGVTRWEAEKQTYTTLTRDKQTVTVHCHGLQAGKTYKLCLYTASRHRGNKIGAWYHPNNYDVEPVAGASDHRIGYGKLAGKAVNGVGVGVFPDVPSWMPNNGFLQTEWNVSRLVQETEINLLTWLPPMVKPVGKTNWTTDNVAGFGIFVTGHMIGVSNQHFAGLLFRFCLVDDEGIAYPCLDTLTVGCGKWKNHDDKLVPRVFVNSTDKALIARDSCLYTSIR